MTQYIKLGLLIFFLPLTAWAGTLHPESAYRDAWCAKARGQTEFVLRDKTRVDCLTANYAVEIEFAPKWKNAVGQALHYARLSGEQPAIVLIIEKEKQWKYYRSLQKIAKKDGIKVWYIKPEDI